MSRPTYRDDTCRTELRGEPDRTGTLQDERANAVNSGIVRDVSDRRSESLSKTESAISEKGKSKGKAGAPRKSHRGPDVVEGDVGPESGLAENAGDERTRRPIGGRRLIVSAADELVYEGLDESDELDDAAPVYRNVRNAQRAINAKRPGLGEKRKAQGAASGGPASGRAGVDTSGSPRTQALLRRSTRTSTLDRSPRQGDKRLGSRFASRRIGQGARSAAAMARRQGTMAAAKTAAASAKAASGATAAATAGAAGFPVAGVMGVILLFVIGVLVIAQAISAIFGFWDNESQKQSLTGLPPYITCEMVEEALACQEEYGHPAGCTIAQIIEESSVGDSMSGLARRDHNLFGMKWAPWFSGRPGVAGSALWPTVEEINGELIHTNARFAVFEGDRECIRFRSKELLQRPNYRDNELMKEAIATHSSDKMAEALQATGWATSSRYAQDLKSLLETYDLYRFDSMTAEDLKEGLISGDAIVKAAYTQLGVPYVWGGTTPGVALDCSGLTQYCYAQAGLSIPRNSEDQHAAGKSVPLSQARPGDILWKPGHVAIFVGGDTYIHAPHTGAFVSIAQGISYFTCAVSFR